MRSIDYTGYTREQLIEELRTNQDQVRELEQRDIQRNQLEKHLQELTRSLSERVKELNCLYAISKLREQSSLTLVQLLQEIVDLIPAAFQYPESTCVRLDLPELKLQTQNFCQTQDMISCDIQVNHNIDGLLEVCSLEPGLPFLREEEALLETIGEQIRSILELHLESRRTEEHQEQLIQFDKMVALGTLVSGVAHEINNPNNFIMLNAPLLQEAWESSLPILDSYYEENGDFLLGGLQYTEMRESVAQLFRGIMDGAKRIRSIVDGLKGFARTDSSELVPGVDMNAVVHSAVTLIRNKINQSTDHFSIQCEPGLPPIKGNFQRLEQVVLNLLQNACEALPDRHHAIRVSTWHDTQDGCIVVTVGDEGVGIQGDKMHNIMDPFFTTKRDIGGTGLGLAVSSSIIAHHEGMIRFSSTPGEGTTVTLSLPLQEKASDVGEDNR